MDLTNEELQERINQIILSFEKEEEEDEKATQDYGEQLKSIMSNWENAEEQERKEIINQMYEIFNPYIEFMCKQRFPTHHAIYEDLSIVAWAGAEGYPFKDDYEIKEKQVSEYIKKIIKRAESLGIFVNYDTHYADIECANYFFTINFNKWLKASDEDFISDFLGIYNNIDRKKAEPFFKEKRPVPVDTFQLFTPKFEKRTTIYGGIIPNMDKYDRNSQTPIPFLRTQAYEAMRTFIETKRGITHANHVAQTKIEKAIRFIEENGQKSTPLKIAKIANLDIKTVKSVISIMGYSTQSVSVEELKENDVPWEIPDNHLSTERQVIKSYENNSLMDAIKRLSTKYKDGKIYQAIIIAKFFLDKDDTEIATMLGIEKEHVEILQNKALSCLREDDYFMSDFYERAKTLKHIEQEKGQFDYFDLDENELQGLALVKSAFTGNAITVETKTLSQSKRLSETINAITKLLEDLDE